jgi:hypothetical protein
MEKDNKFSCRTMVSQNRKRTIIWFSNYLYSSLRQIRKVYVYIYWFIKISSHILSQVVKINKSLIIIFKKPINCMVSESVQMSLSTLIFFSFWQRGDLTLAEQVLYLVSHPFSSIVNLQKYTWWGIWGNRRMQWI